jgi:cytochrome c peroxidase
VHRLACPIALGLLVAACGGGPVGGASPVTDPTSPTIDSAGGAGSSVAMGGAGSSMPAGSQVVEQDPTRAALAPAALPAPVHDPSNAYADNPGAASLGKKLFFDAGFSGALLDLDDDGGPNALGVRGEPGKVSCAGCHDGQNSFLDKRSVFKEISLGAAWTRRRTPSLLDVGQARIVMWGGRFSTLYSQVFGPLENPLEMNSSRLFVAEQVAQKYRSEYESVFGAGTLADLKDAQRFPPLDAKTTGCRLLMDVDHPRAPALDPAYECHGMPGDHAEYDGMTDADRDLVTRVVVNAGKAIAAYERLLTCGPGRFDAWVHGDPSALSDSEQRGYALFVGKAQCVSCHSGPHFSDQKFHNLGLAEGKTRAGVLNGDDHGAAHDLVTAALDPLGIESPYSDGNDGRMPQKLGAELDGAFRTPTLRCVTARPTFMHSGLLHSLTDVVAFLDRGGDPSGSYPGKSELVPLGLSSGEKADLVAFLGTLDGPGPSQDLLSCVDASCAK